MFFVVSDNTFWLDYTCSRGTYGGSTWVCWDNCGDNCVAIVIVIIV